MATQAIDQPALVGIPQIAEIAGVGRSAVSNWRKRHADFPAPKVQTPSGALFDLREVEDWLIEQGKISERAPASARLWGLADAARGIWSPEDFVRFSVAFLVYLEACDRAQRRRASRDVPRPEIPVGAAWTMVRSRSPEHFLRRLLDAQRSVEAANPELAGLLDPGLRDQHSRDADALAYHVAMALDASADEATTRFALFEALDDMEGLDRFAGEFFTPRDVAGLVARLVDAREGTILDPAVGEGGLLMRTAEEAVAGGGHVGLVGIDSNLDACRRSRARFYLGGRDVEIRNEDALTSHPDALSLSDAVVLDPPYGLGNWGTAELYVDPRWRYGSVPPNSADFAWLQLAVTHLKPAGRGAVLMGTGSLFRAGREGGIRRRMVEAGVVEGVVVLSPRLKTNTSIPLALWLLRSPESPDTDEDVLLVDASDLATTGRSRYSLPAGSVDRLVALVERWRADRTISPNDARIAATATREAIIDAESSLLPARYQSPPEVDLANLRQQANSLRASLSESSVAANRATAELISYLERRR
jgi:type I restriction enzyme M protein